MTCSRCHRSGFRPADMAAQFVGYAQSPSAPLRAKHATGRAICPRCVIELEHGDRATQGAML